MKNILLFSFLVNISFSFANDDGAFLDPKYPNLIHPKINKNATLKNFPRSNDVKKIIEFQTPVKSQMARGTCSIFSATGYLEGLLVKNGLFEKSLDLSEEWLEYTAVRNKSSDGSSAWANFNAISNYGMTAEQTFPYIGEDWTEVFNPLKETRCGHLEGFEQTSCFIVHRDPNLLTMKNSEIKEKFNDLEFIAARSEALNFKKNYISVNGSFYIGDVNEVKELLLSGTPVILESDFYYGAWNHRKADEYGIGRNMDHWNKGIVTSPEYGSIDIEQSRKHPAGHSIIVVGFDDDKIVTKKVRMLDGIEKTFTYRGVYYFKNSWGTENFGKDFEIDGEKFPGYGMMVQDYANNYGQFFKLPLE